MENKKNILSLSLRRQVARQRKSISHLTFYFITYFMCQRSLPPAQQQRPKKKTKPHRKKTLQNWDK